jgi:hypothetical protein
MLLLDALYPPSPAQLVADCRAAGAAGCWVYAARFGVSGGDLGIGGWTPAHVAALHEDGKLAPAIIVPGDAPRAVQPMLDVADALGCDPATAFDIENFSFASPLWIGAAIDITRQRGRRPVRYGDTAVLGRYPTADGDWISHGFIPVEAGSDVPVPPLPAGLVADQYAVEVVVNGTAYDVSVADPEFFGSVVVVAAPAVSEEVEMLLLRGPDGGVFLVGGATSAWVPTPADEQALIDAGVKQVQVSQGMIESARVPAAPAAPAVAGQLTVSGTLDVR